MSRLAINGGVSVRDGKTFPVWPSHCDDQAAALREVLDSGIWGIASAAIAEFERAFAAYQQAKYGIAMCNGSVTLRNALLACGVEGGDEVLVPPYTFLATITSVLETNCVPVFVDIDPDTYCMDPAAIEAKITSRTRAIIPVHIGGNPADMDRIMAIARKHDLYVIEDAAHAVGAEYKHRRVGSIGDFGSFSFQSSKNLCSGEGGVIVANDDRLAERCWSVHNCGRTRTGAWYSHPNLGGNYRLGAFQAAILKARMKTLDAEIELRSRNAELLRAKLKAVPGLRPLVRSAETTRHAWHLFVMRYDKAAFGNLPRSAWLKALAAEGLPIAAGYDTPQYQHDFMRNRAFASFNGWRNSNPDLDYNRVSCPVCEKASREEGCWLNQNVLLGSEADLDDIVEAIAKVQRFSSEVPGA